MEKYIPKDFLISEIRNKVDSYRGDGILSIGVLKQHCEDFISSLDTLKVREADLEKEIKSYFKGFGKFPSVGIDDCIDIAKHFFELGLKAQKGE